MANAITLYNRIPAKPFVFGYAALYALLLVLMVQAGALTPVEPLFVMAVLGVGFTFLAWLLTRRTERPALPPMRAGAESGAILLYLLVFAFGFLGWGLSWLKLNLTDPRSHDLAVSAAKLLTMVLLPALVLRAFGHPLREQLRWNFQWRRHGLVFVVLAVALLLFQFIFSRSVASIQATHASTGMVAAGLVLCFTQLCIDTGLTEEFLFRVALQTRLAAWFRSETGGVLVMSVLFGLAHAPGYYLRAVDPLSGGHPTALVAIGYTVVMLSVFGFMFGMLWARTRSLGLIVMLHAVTDTLPNTAEFMQTWMGAAAPSP